jgi:hypothetical protein
MLFVGQVCSFGKTASINAGIDPLLFESEP